MILFSTGYPSSEMITFTSRSTSLVLEDAEGEREGESGEQEHGETDNRTTNRGEGDSQDPRP